MIFLKIINSGSKKIIVQQDLFKYLSSYLKSFESPLFNLLEKKSEALKDGFSFSEEKEEKKSKKKKKKN